MERALIIGLLSVACATVSSFGQGTISVDTYNVINFSFVSYGSSGIPANGVSGTPGNVNGGLQQGWTMGLYYVVGNVTVGSDPSGNTGDPSTFGGLTLATGSGTTAPFGTSLTGFLPGYALSPVALSVPGTSSAGGDIITVEIVAYSGSSYSAALYRGHSATFTMPTAAFDSNPTKVGNYMPSFSVFPVPEPSVFALAGLSAVAVVFFRRR